jgi:hypothetical protein
MLTKNVRIKSPNLFTPSSYSPDQKPKYTATFIFEPDDPQIKALEDHIKEIVRKKWPKGSPDDLKICLRPNSEKDRDGFTNGGH